MLFIGHPRSVLHRLGHMIGRDQVAVGDGSYQFENAMIGTGRKEGWGLEAQVSSRRKNYSLLNTANKQYGFTADQNNASEQQSVLTERSPRQHRCPGLDRFSPSPPLACCPVVVTAVKPSSSLLKP